MAAGTGNGRRLEFWLPPLLVVVDQIAKLAVRQALPLHASITVIPGFFDLTHVRNTGTAFGFLNGVDFPYKAAVIAVIATLALAAVAAYGWSLPRAHQLARTALAFILGGAAGNLVDRVRTGFVVDFADFYWRGWHFWAFNVADSAITIGVALLILDMLIPPPHASHPV
jgi:signal peptidase II